MPAIRILVMLATMMMKLVKTAKEKKVFKNVGVSIMGITFWEAIKDSIKKQIKKSDWICGNVKTADDYLKTHPNSWLNSAIGVATITTMLMNVCFADDQSKKEVAQAQKEAENARDRANKSGIELANNQIKVEQEKQKTNNIETNNQIKVEQEQQKTEQEKQKTEQEKQKTFNTQKDLVKKAEQNCQEKHGQFFIEKLGIKGGIAIEIEKAQELIAYLQKELESLPYSQKAIAKQVDFYKPSSIAYLELDPRDFKVTEEWHNENLKIRSKAQAKMLEMRKPQAHLSPFQSFSILQNIVADINKGIEAAANTEKKAEKVGYGYSKRM
ncbi:hypothetical protein VN0637_06630 [Helicobacter pylori]